MLNPKHFETAWIRLENKLLESLINKKWLKPFLFFSSILVAYLTFGLWTQTQFPQWSRFNLFQDRLWATYVIFFSSFIPLFFKLFRNSTRFLFVVLATSWLVPIYYLKAFSFHALLPIIFILLSSYITSQLVWNRFVRSILVFVLFVVLVSLVTQNAIDSQNHKVLLYFSNLHMDLSLLYFVGAIFNRIPFSPLLHFNPLQFVSPSPIPENTQLSKNDLDYEKQFIRGWLEIAQAQLIFFIIIIFLKIESIATTQNSFIHYIIFIATITGAMKMLSCFLWIYGFQSISSTNFVFLAKSPIEVWQRGAVFIADFLFNKIYLPTWRKFRSLSLSTIAVTMAILFHLFIFHEWIVKAFLRLQFGNLLFGTYGWAETKQWILWTLSWLVWILVFFVFQKFTKKLHAISIFQWFLVVLTHLGSAMILPISFYLSRII